MHKGGFQIYFIYLFLCILTNRYLGEHVTFFLAIISLLLFPIHKGIIINYYKMILQEAVT